MNEPIFIDENGSLAEYKSVSVSATGSRAVALLHSDILVVWERDVGAKP